MTISFIIPAYNASSTIVRTLDSIMTQSWGNISYEVIIIDDCSKDKTVQIVEKYRERLRIGDLKFEIRNLTLLRQPENHRQGAARNRGLREAKGEYVMFVDADDMVESGVTDAVKQIVRMQADVIFCDYLWMYSQTHIERRSMQLEDGHTESGHDFCERYYDTIINSCPISYIWKREYLLNKGMPFLEDRRMEDFDWIERNLYGACKVGYSKSIIYRVMTYENLNSTTHTVTPETSADWAHAGYRRMLFCDEIRKEAPSYAEKIEYQSRCFISSILKFRNLSKFSPKGIVQLKRRMGDEALLYLIKKGQWNKETDFCMKHIDMIVCADILLYPVALLGRIMVRSIRTKKNR